MQSPYTEDYYLRGKSAGLSNYENYRWMEPETMALAQRVIEVMRISPGDCLLDVGCARGYLVKAMRRLGVNAYGYDISEWAIENCDPDVKGYVSTNSPTGKWDHIWSKDCLEHVDEEELRFLLPDLISMAAKSVLLIVPLCEQTNSPYLREEDNFDKTHKIRWTLQDWIWYAHEACTKEGWSVFGSFHIDGLKPASFDQPGSCGFILLMRA